MNTFGNALTNRIQAIAGAVAVTLAMLGAINSLAISEPPAALVAAISAARA